MADDDRRRREARAPIELKVEYKRLNTFFYDYTKNISKGGTFIKTEKPLDVGTDLPVQADAADRRRSRSRCAARFAGSSRTARRCRPRCRRATRRGWGSSSSTTAPASGEQLENIVEQMMTDSLGRSSTSGSLKPPRRRTQPCRVGRESYAG